ncbi:hypothetical protein J0674_24455, partial [Vibrio parahaemolyticus]|uniref:hypothetical protein n=1 Tax=Vibrio parahaemolyticus TaxID=670 RepID=UPI001A8D1916
GKNKTVNSIANADKKKIVSQIYEKPCYDDILYHLLEETKKISVGRGQIRRTVFSNGGSEYKRDSIWKLY